MSFNRMFNTQFLFLCTWTWFQKNSKHPFTTPYNLISSIGNKMLKKWYRLGVVYTFMDFMPASARKTFQSVISISFSIYGWVWHLTCLSMEYEVLFLCHKHPRRSPQSWFKLGPVYTVLENLTQNHSIAIRSDSQWCCTDLYCHQEKYQ